MNYFLIHFRLITGLQLNTTVDISSDEIDLDHRLHFQVATEYFTHNDEQIKLHFKVMQEEENENILFIYLVFCCSFNNK